jgi:hypothetical protein
MWEQMYVQARTSTLKRKHYDWEQNHNKPENNFNKPMSETSAIWTVITERQDSNRLQTNIMATILFPDDHVTITASENSVHRSLHQLSKAALTCKLTICSVEAEILVLKGEKDKTRNNDMQY